jgi:hypothetical protein
MFTGMLNHKTCLIILIGLCPLWLIPRQATSQSSPNSRITVPPPPDLPSYTWNIRSETGIELTGLKAPFTLYDALWRQKKIAHPYSRQTSDSLQWVEHQIWICRLDFEVDSAQAARGDGRIVFEEIMTHARV